MQNPWALFALATVALPWLLLLRRRPTTPPPRVLFPAVRLLAPTLRRSAKRKVRRRLALATLRSLTFLVLAFLWANPILRAPSSSDQAAPPTPLTTAFTSPLQRVADGKIDGRPTRILIVDGGDSGPPFPDAPASRSASEPSASAAFYLAAALNPEFDAPQPVFPQRFPEIELISSAEFALTPFSALNAFDALCWVDLSAPTDAELEKTARFLAPSPSVASPLPPRALIIFAGPRTDVKRWNTLWKRWNLDAKTVAVEFDPATGALAPSTDAATRETLQRLANVNVKEQAFAAAFADFERSGADSLPIWRSFPLVGVDAIPVLRDAASNVPTLTRLAAPQRGAVLWFATAPDASTSALAFAPSFVPLLDRTVEFALQESLANPCVSDVSDAAFFPDALADRSVLTQKNADAPLDKKSARRRLDLDLVFWGAFGLLIAFEFWRSAPRRSAAPTA